MKKYLVLVAIPACVLAVSCSNSGTPSDAVHPSSIVDAGDPGARPTTDQADPAVNAIVTGDRESCINLLVPSGDPAVCDSLVAVYAEKGVVDVAWVDRGMETAEPNPNTWTVSLLATVNTATGSKDIPANFELEEYASGTWGVRQASVEDWVMVVDAAVG